MRLLYTEAMKLWHLTSFRLSIVIFLLFPILWAYAPGVFDVYGFYIVSGFQVPGLVLRSSMEFLLPLLVALASGELFGLELTYGTIRSMLLKPISRGGWILAKIAVCVIYPFLLLYILLALSLLAGTFFGFESFSGGTGVGTSGIVGLGIMQPRAALLELLQAYTLAAYTLVPIALLALAFSVIFMSAAAGALGALTVIIVLRLLVVFPSISPYLLTSQLDAYLQGTQNLGGRLVYVLIHIISFVLLTMFVFDRKDV